MPRHSTIIGLDPGLRWLGWGIVRCEGNRLTYVASGTIGSTASDGMALRLKALHDALCNVIAAASPDSAAVEETFVNANARGAMQLAQARAIALLAPALAGIAVAEYAANLIKKSVVGSGHAGKDQVRVMVGHLLPGCAPSTEHEADALAVAITHAHLSQTTARWNEAVKVAR